MAKVDQPKWDQSQDYTVGLEALELAGKYKKALEVRLPAGLLEGLKEDVDRLGAIGAEKRKGVARVKGFTGSQNEALKEAAKWCLAVRDALKKGKAPESVKKAAGVGMIFPNRGVSVAVASLNAVLETYERFPDIYRTCGVLPDDLTEGKSLLTALQSADAEQEGEKTKKKETTQGRIALRLRIEAAVDRIIGGAGMAFKDQPEVLKLFADLIPGTKKKPPKKPEAAKPN